MDKLKQRIKIAEACGCVFDDFNIRCPKGRKQTYMCGLGRDRERYNVANAEDAIKFGIVPDYLNDLNAMHEAEKILDFTQRETYRANLAKNFYELGYDESRALSHSKAIHSTAAQRAEAFLKTIGKWED